MLNTQAPFIGRKSDLETLARLLSQHRVVTIVAPGGMGKSRLAAEFAARRRPDDGIVCFLHVAGLSDANVGLAQLAQALGLRIPAGDSAERICTEYLGERETLLVFDEAERAPAIVELLRTIHSRCPLARFLITSRALVTIAGERAFTLGPLDGAAELFTDRISAIRPGLTIDARARSSIEHLCERLGGVPLAIERAAAQIGSRSAPATSLAQLDRQFAAEHLRTLSGMLEWSYRSLTQPQNRLFARLGIFAESFRLEAVNAIALRGGDSGALDDLVAKALVKCTATPHGPRFSLHPVVREFALERLATTGELVETRARFCEHFCTFVWQTWTGDLGNVPERIETTALEWPNVREALHLTLEERNDAALGYKAVLALNEYWTQSGKLTDGWYWILNALEVADSGAQRSDMLYAAAMNAHGRGDFVELERLCRELLTLYESSGDCARLARALNGLANARYRLGDSEEAEALYWRALEQYRVGGDRRGEAVALMNIGALKADRLVDYTRAREYFLESLAIFREFGPSSNVGTLLANLAEISSRLGDHERALEYAQKSRALFEQLGNEGLAAWQMINVAQFHLERDALGAAIESLREARHAWKEQLVSREHASSFLDVTFMLAADLGDAEFAAKLYGYTQRFRELYSLERSPSEHRVVEPRYRRVREALGDERWAELWAEGESLDEDAIDEYVSRIAPVALTRKEKSTI